MSAIEELQSKINGDVTLLDTSALTPYEEETLGRILYDGLDGLERINGVDLARRIGRLQEIERFMKAYPLVTIPEVCKEAERHLDTLNEQQAFLASEIREIRSDLERNDFFYYRDMLTSINDHNRALHHCLVSLQKRVKGESIRKDVGQRYQSFFDAARVCSKDLVEKTRRKKLQNRHPIYQGILLETDQHLVATALTLSYNHPVTLVTGDKGLKELLARVYEILVQERLRMPSTGGAYLIPCHSLNVFNPRQYDEEEVRKVRKLESRLYGPEWFGEEERSA